MGEAHGLRNPNVRGARFQRDCRAMIAETPPRYAAQSPRDSAPLPPRYAA